MHPASSKLLASSKQHPQTSCALSAQSSDMSRNTTSKDVCMSWEKTGCCYRGSKCPQSNHHTLSKHEVIRHLQRQSAVDSITIQNLRKDVVVVQGQLKCLLSVCQELKGTVERLTQAVVKADSSDTRSEISRGPSKTPHLKEAPSSGEDTPYTHIPSRGKNKSLPVRLSGMLVKSRSKTKVTRKPGTEANPRQPHAAGGGGQVVSRERARGHQRPSQTVMNPANAYYTQVPPAWGPVPQHMNQWMGFPADQITPMYMPQQEPNGMASGGLGTDLHHLCTSEVRKTETFLHTKFQGPESVITRRVIATQSRGDCRQGYHRRHYYHCLCGQNSLALYSSCSSQGMF